MIGAGITTERWLVQRISEEPAILGLGDLQYKRARPSCRAGQVNLVLHDPAESSLYVVEIQFGPADDRHVIRAVERWAVERKRHPRQRCFAVLVAEEIAPRYLNILQLIGGAVPLLALQMQVSRIDGDVAVQFTRLCSCFDQLAGPQLC